MVWIKTFCIHGQRNLYFLSFTFWNLGYSSISHINYISRNSANASKNTTLKLKPIEGTIVRIWPTQSPPPPANENEAWVGNRYSGKIHISTRLLVASTVKNERFYKIIIRWYLKVVELIDVVILNKWNSKLWRY